SFNWSNRLALRRVPIALLVSALSALGFGYLGGWLSGGAIGVALCIAVWLGGGLSSASLQRQLQPGQFLLRSARSALQASLLIGSLIVGAVALTATFFALFARVAGSAQAEAPQQALQLLALEVVGVLLLGMGVAALCFGALSCL